MKTIALIRLLFTCSQRLRSRQLGLSPSPDRLTGRRPTSSSPSDSNGPYGHLPGTGRASAARADSNMQDKLLRACPRCVPIEKGMVSGLLSLSGSHCLLSGAAAARLESLPLPPAHHHPHHPNLPSFQDLLERVQVALQVQVNSHYRLNSLRYNVFISYQRCHRRAGIPRSY